MDDSMVVQDEQPMRVELPAVDWSKNARSTSGTTNYTIK